MSPPIAPFEERHLGGAARLLAARHRRDRAAESLLPQRFEDAGACRRLLEKALQEGAEGAVLRDGADIAGYLLAVPGDDARGRHTWAGLEHHAGAPGAGPDAIRPLYAHLAARWIEARRIHHYAVVPAADVAAWQHLAFAHEQIHAVRETAAARAEAPADRRWSLRIAGPGDLDAIAPLTRAIADAHAASPVFAVIDAAFYENLLPGTLELLGDASSAYWIAEEGGEVVGYTAMRPIPPAEGSLLKPAGAVELLLAATSPRVRGAGVGVALCEKALAWAAERGFRVCVTDWRAANLASSPFWPKRGFRPMAYRLHRIVDPRVVAG